MRHLFVFVSVSLLMASSSQAQEVTTGPEKGATVPALKVFDATGAHKDKEVDYAADRAGKPTVYLFIDADKFDRPMNRFMKTLDGITGQGELSGEERAIGSCSPIATGLSWAAVGTH
jgi:hypothetical protein